MCNVNILTYCVSLAIPVDGLTIDDIRRGLIDADAAINNISVTSRIEIIQTSLVNPSNIVALRLATKCSVDRQGRVRYEAIGDEMFDGQQPTVSPISVRAVFDGQFARVVRGTAEKDLSARISRNRTAVSWRIDPWNFLGTFMSKPVSERLAQEGTKIVGESNWESRKVYVIETAPVTRENVSRKLQFMVDAFRNFAVVRKAALVSYATEGTWHDYAVIEGRHYDELVPGIWLPREVKQESFKVIEGANPELSGRSTINNERWSVNDQLPDSLFAMSFPDGVHVTDEVSGREYRNTNVTDQKISDAATAAKELQQTYARMRTPDDILRGKSRFLWPCLIVGSSAACVVLALYILVRWRKRAGI